MFEMFLLYFSLDLDTSVQPNFISGSHQNTRIRISSFLGEQFFCVFSNQLPEYLFVKSAHKGALFRMKLVKVTLIK